MRRKNVHMCVCARSSEDPGQGPEVTYICVPRKETVLISGGLPPVRNGSRSAMAEADWFEPPEENKTEK
ncbi:MAG: hypothetical protein QF535_06230 [Anaerolineales bacterium]|nr:hypothetical protein [Anaerolineales bacterium]